MLIWHQIQRQEYEHFRKVFIKGKVIVVTGKQVSWDNHLLKTLGETSAKVAILGRNERKRKRKKVQEVVNAGGEAEFFRQMYSMKNS